MEDGSDLRGRREMGEIGGFAVVKISRLGLCPEMDREEVLFGWEIGDELRSVYEVEFG